MKGAWKPRNECRVALYARVSSDKQAQQGTIDSQVSLIRERIETEGWVLEDALCFLDDGISGTTLVRPALERLRDQAAAQAIDRLYVLAPDRLARRHVHQMVLVEELQACGVEVVFLNRPLGTTPEDQLLLQVQGMIGEYERAKLLERTRRGRLHAARCGRVSVLGQAPFGYRYLDKQTGHGVAAYEIIEEEAEIVREIFAWVGLEGCSLREVGRRLERLGVRTRHGLNRWNQATVLGMLRNSAYRGQAAFGKSRVGERRPRLRPRRGEPEVPKRAATDYPQPASSYIYIPVPAIVTEDVFAAVQERLEHNRKHLRESTRGARYLLQGLAVCGCCGYAIYGQSCSGKRAYYRCLGRDASRYGGQAICDNRTQRCDDVEAAVWNDVCALLTEPDRLREEYERRQQRRDSPTMADRDCLQRALTKTKQGISRLLDAYTEGLVDSKEFEPRMRGLKERLTKLEGDLQALDREVQQDGELRLVFSHLETFADEMKAGLSSVDWHQRREILRVLVKRVEIDKENIRIVYRVPARPFAKGPDGGLVRDCWTRLACRCRTNWPKWGAYCRVMPGYSVKRTCAYFRALPGPAAQCRARRRRRSSLDEMVIVPASGSSNRRR
jgi:site-specific DNA recombinase